MTSTATSPRAVLIGASAGGVEALLQVLSPLPQGYSLPIVVALHLPEDRDSVIAEVFQHHMKMPVREARDKEAIECGSMYFAPAGYHLLIEKDHTFALNCDPPVNHARPSIDLLFESASVAWRNAVCAVLLTGANDDGARGLAVIARGGGRTAVQDPATARAEAMPLAAIARYSYHPVLPLQGIGAMLLDLDPRKS